MMEYVMFFWLNLMTLESGHGACLLLPAFKADALVAERNDQDHESPVVYYWTYCNR